MFNFDMQTVGISEAIDGLIGLQEQLAQSDDVIQIVATILRDSAKERFITKQDPQGKPWEDLKPSTVKHKEKYGVRSNAMNILVNHGDLGRNIIYQILNNHSAKVGSTQWYGNFHQQGTSKMPQRAFLGVSDDDNATIREALNEFLEEEALRRMRG